MKNKYGNAKKRAEKTTTLDASNPRHEKHIKSYFDKFKKRSSEAGYIDSQLGVWRLFGKFTNEKNPSDSEIEEYRKFTESSSIAAHSSLVDDIAPLSSKIKSIHDSIIEDTGLDEEEKTNKLLGLAAEAAIIQTENAVRNREANSEKIKINLTPNTNPKLRAISVFPDQNVAKKKFNNQL